MADLTLSLPTGRLKDECVELLSQVLPWPETLKGGSRCLVYEDKTFPWKILFSHPKDSSTYVEFGIADLGIVGKDILLERENHVFELLDLGIGRCTMVLAGPQGLSRAELIEREHIRIATKYPAITQRYMTENGLTGDLIYLYGSIELAPAMGLADAIVDLVSTGKTLQENRLEIVDEICPVSARLVANRVSIRTRGKAMASFLDRLREVVHND